MAAEHWDTRTEGRTQEMRTSRSLKMIIVAAAALAVCVDGASALAARLPGTGGRSVTDCRISLSFLNRVITAHESVTALGTLRCRRATASLAGEPVTLYERPLGSPAYAIAATGTTEAGGAYALVAPDVTSDSSFYVSAAGATSAVKDVGVLAEVNVKGPPEGVLFTRTTHHTPVKFEGTVSPTDKHALVILQRQNALNGNGWVSIGYGRVTEAGTFTILHNFVIPGPANIRVLVRDAKVTLASPSNVLGYEVSQAENPLLRIESSADPISYGQSVTISGTVVGVPAGTPVTLVARSPKVPLFTVVEEGKTGAGGAYSFPSLSPTAGTFYRALCAGKSSAVLFEGVKYVLTASVSGPGTVGLGQHLTFTTQEGQRLTFSGTVKPGVTNHWVYLERENAAHTAFHVVETGEVHPPELPAHPEYWYSITYAPASAGTSTMRIKIPGDPQNGGTESETFTLEVSASPASTLTPGGPARFPSEGQT